MVFKRDDGYNVSDTGNWNVAADYSKLKIMKPLYLSDVYENIAKFGYESILEELENYAIPSDVIKLKGFERLINELLKLIQNSKFAMKSAGTKDKIEEYEKELKKVLVIIPTLSEVVTKLKSKELILKKEKYERILNLVLEIKSKLNDPLNKNHLIFTDKEEFDPQAYKEQIIKAATTRG